MKNLLPKDGNATYFSQAIPTEIADSFFDQLFQEIQWQHDHLVLFGKPIITKRKVAWYADSPLNYTYSNATKTALIWNDCLKEIKLIVEKTTESTYNSCLLNLYHDGSEGMGWHSDDEKEIRPGGSIASLSLGAERDFFFKHKLSGEKVEIFLEHGSILDMRGLTQEYWQHQLPVRKRIKEPRINLTFRRFIDDGLNKD